MKTLLSKSLLMIFLRPLAFLESRTLKFVRKFAPVIVRDVLRSAIDFADATSLIDKTASIKRLAHDYASLKFFSFLVLGSGISHQSFWLLQMNIKTCVVVRVSPGHVVLQELCKNCSDGQASGYALKQTNSTTSINPFLHYLWQQIQAVSRILCGLSSSPKVRCNALVLGNVFCRPVKTFRDLYIFGSRAKNFCLWCIGFLSFDINRSSQLRNVRNFQVARMNSLMFTIMSRKC